MFRLADVGPQDHEEALIFSVAKLMLNDIQWFLDSSSKSSIRGALYTDRQALKTKLMSLINFCLCPEAVSHVRLRMVKSLCYEANIDLVLKYLLQGNPTQLRLFNAFMNDLVKTTLVDVAGDDLARNDAMEFYFNLKKWGILVKNESTPIHSTPDTVTANFKSQLGANRKTYAKRSVKHIEKTLSQYDELITHVTKKAMEVTEVAVKAQDDERKKMMVAIRDALSEKVRARQSWQQIAEIATHEKGVWHMPDSCSKSWALGK